MATNEENQPGQQAAMLYGDSVNGEVEGAVVVEEREQEFAHRLEVRSCWEFEVLIKYKTKNEEYTLSMVQLTHTWTLIAYRLWLWHFAQIRVDGLQVGEDGRARLTLKFIFLDLVLIVISFLIKKYYAYLKKYWYWYFLKFFIFII
jgi:hypothetical protein